MAVLTEHKENFEAAEDPFTDENVFLTFSGQLDESSFERVGLDRSRAVLVNRNGDAENLITILGIKDITPDARILVCAYNEELIPTFNRAGATYGLSRQDILARIVSHYITSPEEQVFTEDFLTSAQKDGVVGVTEAP